MWKLSRRENELENVRVKMGKISLSLFVFQKNWHEKAFYIPQFYMSCLNIFPLIHPLTDREIHKRGWYGIWKKSSWKIDKRSIFFEFRERREIEEKSPVTPPVIEVEISSPIFNYFYCKVAKLSLIIIGEWTLDFIINFTFQITSVSRQTFW